MALFFTKTQYQHIANDFNLGKISSLEYFKQGYAAPKVMVKTTKGKYVIAKQTIGKGDNFKNKPLSSVQSEVKLLSSLKNLPAPKYLKNIDKQYIVDVNGFAVTVYSYLEGKHPKVLNNYKVKELGEFLGKFHVQGSGIKDGWANRYKYYDYPLSRIKAMKPYAYQQSNSKLKAVAPEVEQGIIDNKLSKSLPQGPIHVDIKHDNELFKGNSLTGIVDFGNFYKGPLLLDIGKTILFNCVVKQKLNLTMMENFLKGYEKHRKLTKKERGQLLSAIRFALYSHVWLDLYHVPLKLVPQKHTLYYVETFLPAIRELK